MSTTRIRIDPDNPATLPEGRFDPAVVDGTTESEIAMQQQEDDAEAMARHGALCAPDSAVTGGQSGGAGASHQCAAGNDP